MTTQLRASCFTDLDSMIDYVAKIDADAFWDMDGAVADHPDGTPELVYYDRPQPQNNGDWRRASANGGKVHALARWSDTASGKGAKPGQWFRRCGSKRGRLASQNPAHVTCKACRKSIGFHVI